MAFAVVGIFFFDRLIVKNKENIDISEADNLLYLMNFNDFGSAFVTLSAILITGDFELITDMYIDGTGTEWVRVYFLLFWLSCCCIILNILLSFLLDIYDSVCE